MALNSTECPSCENIQNALTSLSNLFTGTEAPTGDQAAAVNLLGICRGWRLWIIVALLLMILLKKK